MKIHKRLSIIFTAVIILSLVLVGSATAKSLSKVEVCQQKGNGTYELVKVNANTLQNHLAHGDILPGGTVPGQQGVVLGADCTLSSTMQNGQDQSLNGASTFNNGKKAEKVEVCHRIGTGAFILININGNALPAHLRHGDGLPNGEIANLPGKYLTSTCSISEVPQRELVETLYVNSNSATNGVFNPVPSGDLINGQLYEIAATGTYTYNINIADSWADAEWFNKTEFGGVIQGEDRPEYALHPNVLDLSVYTSPVTDNCAQNTNWGAYQPTTHAYTTSRTVDNGKLYFCIYDSNYTDNVGSLTVQIWKINW